MSLAESCEPGVHRPFWTVRVVSTSVRYSSSGARRGVVGGGGGLMDGTRDFSAAALTQPNVPELAVIPCSRSWW